MYQCISKPGRIATDSNRDIHPTQAYGLVLLLGLSRLKRNTNCFDIIAIAIRIVSSAILFG